MKPDLEHLRELFKAIQRGEKNYSSCEVKYIYSDGSVAMKIVSHSTLLKLFKIYLDQTPFEVGKRGIHKAPTKEEEEIIIENKNRYKCGINKLREIFILKDIDISQRRINEIYKTLAPTPPIDLLIEKVMRKRYEVSHVNAMWHGDIHFIFHNGEVKYLFVLIDDKSRLVVNYGLSFQKDSQFVIDVLNEAFIQGEKPICYFSDNGKENTSRLTKKFLADNEVLSLTTFPYNPQQNGKIESFWKPLQRFIDEKKSKTDRWENIDEYVYDFITKYNHEMPHFGLPKTDDRPSRHYTPSEVFNMAKFKFKEKNEVTINIENKGIINFLKWVRDHE